MWLPRLIEGARLKYLGIVEALEADIRSGLVTSGERLPPQRAIAEALDVDITTVTRAFNEARRRGLVEAHAGRGTFASETLGGTRSAETRPALIDLSMNIPPQPEAVDLRKLLSQGISGILGGSRGASSLHYHESTGTDLDRHAAAKWLARWVEGVTPDRVVVAGGAQSALFAVCDLLMERGDVMVAGAMTYPGLKAIAAHKGLVLEPLEMDADGIIPESFEKACRVTPPKALYVVPTMDNPTTATLPEGRRRKLAALAQKHGVAIIEDDPYAPLRPERIASMADLAGDITWHIATLSKCVTPALRIAYVAAPNVNMAMRLAGTLRATVLMAPPLGAALASRWIGDGTLEGIASAVRAENVERQTLAASMLGDVAFAADPHGYHLWVRLPDHWRASDFAEQADRTGVAIAPSSAFAIAPHPPETLRLSLGAAADRDALQQGLELVADLMAQPSLAIRAVV